MQLRPYQQQAKQDIYGAWDDGHSNVLAVLPTGAGKTVIGSDILLDHNAPSCAIAHRQELVTQISVALNRDCVPHRIIGPPKVIKLAVSLHMEDAGISYYNPSAACGVAGVDTLVRREVELRQWRKSVTLWWQDECFPAGTLIDGRPIEGLEVGDYVTALNEKTGGFEKRRINRLFKNPEPAEMVRVATRSHHVLDCTKGHPFYTRRGWVPAGDLTPKDEVLIYDLHKMWGGDNHDDGVSALPVSENRADLLHEEMRLRSSGRKQGTEATHIEAGRLLYLRNSNNSNRDKVKPLPKYRTGVLQQSVLQDLQVESILGDDERDESEVRIGEDEEKQSNVSGGLSAKDVGDTKTPWPWPEGARRQRKTSHQSRKGAFSLTGYSRVQFTGKGADGSEGCGHEVPGTLQNRLRESRELDRCRGGRPEPRQPKTARTGRTEGQISYWCRLESVSIHQRKDTGRTGDGFVYNIEVDELHTYVAAGVVVHNCHHVLEDNKWGTAAKMFPNAKGLGVTATPIRADGRGLGRHADGLFDTMVEGPSMRWLIDNKYLTDYRIFAPPSDLDLGGVKTSSDGDFNKNDVKTAVRKSHVVGDVVKHYLRIAPGRLGVTFATDVETATDIAAQFNLAGVPAAVVSAKTPDSERAAILRRFRNRELLQLVNVDLFGEGFDLPAIEVVSMARPTQSFALFAQQFGRTLRLLAGKLEAIIIDHVGNVVRHGLPDAPRVWTLDRREKRSKGGATDVIPVTACPECTAVYERTHAACPFCGHKVIPVARSGPEFVDGDLAELDAETLASMRGEILHVDMTVAEARADMESRYVPEIGIRAGMKRHRERQEVQEALRASIAWWAGWQRARGVSDSESYRRFYFMFGVDVMTAQTLGSREALQLAENVNRKLGEMGC